LRAAPAAAVFDIYEPGDPVSAAWMQLTLDGGSKFFCVNDARVAVANAAKPATRSSP
jgi:hypothetical protein